MLFTFPERSDMITLQQATASPKKVTSIRKHSSAAANTRRGEQSAAGMARPARPEAKVLERGGCTASAASLSPGEARTRPRPAGYTACFRTPGTEQAIDILITRAKCNKYRRTKKQRVCMSDTTAS